MDLIPAPLSNSKRGFWCHSGRTMVGPQILLKLQRFMNEKKQFFDLSLIFLARKMTHNWSLSPSENDQWIPRAWGQK
jgi:hypothetical protein